MQMRTLILIAAISCLLAGTAAAAIDINGVKVEETTEVQGTKLPLNGAGTRYKAIFKVYVAALYASKKVTNLDELIAAPGPKKVAVTMLRDIDAGELGKLLTRGMEDNMGKAEISKMVPGLLRMGQIFGEQKKLQKGDTFSLEWVPGNGTIMTIKGNVQGEPFKEPEFFKALMGIWLGPAPADWKLKDALLGQKPSSN